MQHNLVLAAEHRFPFSGVNTEGKKIFLRDIWPTREELQAIERRFVIPAMFKEVYEKIEVNVLALP